MTIETYLVHHLLLFCFTTVKPKFVNNAGTLVEVNKQEMLIFNCSAYGISAPNIVWQKKGQLVIDTANKFEVVNTIYNVTNSQEGTFSFLIVSNLTTTDSGNYSCRSDNNEGLEVVMETPYVLIVTGMLQ